MNTAQQEHGGPDWAALVLSEAHQARIRRLCERILGDDPAHVEGASLHVIEELARDDWARCRVYQGKSTPDTWLYTLSLNLIRAYRRRHVVGRQRVPSWIEAQPGPIWRKVWHRLVVCGRRPHEVVHDLITGPAHTEQEVREVIRRILEWQHRASSRRGRRGVPGGPSHRVRLVCESDSPECAMALAAASEDGADCWRRRAYEELLLWLDQWLSGAEGWDTWEALDGDALRRAACACQLSDEARLVLRLHYVEGRGWRDIARALGLPGHQPARIAARACRAIGEALDDAGIDCRLLLSARARTD